MQGGADFSGRDFTRARPQALLDELHDGEYPAIYDTEQEAVEEAIAQNTPDPILRNVADRAARFVGVK